MNTIYTDEYGQFDIEDHGKSMEEIAEICQERLGAGLPEGYKFFVLHEAEGRQVIAVGKDENEVICRVMAQRQDGSRVFYIRHKKETEKFLPVDIRNKKLIWDRDIKPGPYED